MPSLVQSLVEACQWSPSYLLIVSDNVFVPLIYYSHLGSVVASLVLGLFVFFNGHKQLANQLLLLLVLSFTTWIFADLVTWATEFPAHTMFAWTLLIIFEPVIYFLAFYFFYVLIFGKDLSSVKKTIFVLPLLVTFALAPTLFGLLGYNLANCDRAAVEGIIATYGYVIEIMYLFLILGFSFSFINKTTDPSEKRKAAIITAGIIAFLLSFSLGNIAEVFTQNWYIGQYGLLGAPIFVAFLAFVMVKYKTFNTKIFGTQALITSLWILTLSLIFIRKIENVRIVVLATLILLSTLGYQLIKGVRREIYLREELQEANEGQANLIHIINHQIKGYMTKARYAFDALLTDREYSAIDSAKVIVQEGYKSVTEGVNFVTEFLNASNIEKGTYTYAMEPVDLKVVVEETSKSIETNAKEKGLAYTLNVAPGEYKITGDKAQLGQAVRNYIDNSIRYTPAGSVNVQLSMSNDQRKAVFTVTDTGVGLSEEVKPKLFTKGGRDKDSRKININSTGFGLAFVKGVAEAHKGRVWAESAGAGKGSTFYMELPLS